MKASSASGLCASRIVRIELAALPGGATRLPAGNFGRLLVKRVEVLAVLGVLGALLGAFVLLVAQEVAIGAERAGGVALELQGASLEHEGEQVSRDRAADRVRLRQRRGRVPAGQVEHANRSEEHTSELQSHSDLVCRLLLEKKKNKKNIKETNK